MTDKNDLALKMIVERLHKEVIETMKKIPSGFFSWKEEKHG